MSIENNFTGSHMHALRNQNDQLECRNTRMGIRCVQCSINKITHDNVPYFALNMVHTRCVFPVCLAQNLADRCNLRSPNCFRFHYTTHYPGQQTEGGSWIGTMVNISHACRQNSWTSRIFHSNTIPFMWRTQCMRTSVHSFTLQCAGARLNLP